VASLKCSMTGGSVGSDAASLCILKAVWLAVDLFLL
jgi:hypothetical protein